MERSTRSATFWRVAALGVVAVILATACSSAPAGSAAPSAAAPTTAGSAAAPSAAAGTKHDAIVNKYMTDD